MSTNEENNTGEQNRLEMLLIAHGAAVLLIGLLAGVLLIFSMLDGFVLWPILDIPHDLPGTVRGWKAAHVGGLTNGIMMFAIVFVVSKVPLSFGKAKFVCWAFIITGWGNTVFYWAGNLAANRGISAQGNQYGESDTAGMIAFVGGGSVMLVTIAATIILLVGAFTAAKQKAVDNN